MAADLYKESFICTPGKLEQSRYRKLHGYTSILREKYFRAGEVDLEFLKKIADDKKCPKIFRCEAAFTLGLLSWDDGERITAAEYYRRVLRLADRCDEKERKKPMLSSVELDAFSSNTTVGDIIREITKTVSDNLGILENHSRSYSSQQSIPRSDGSTMQKETRFVTSFHKGAEDRLNVGGNACDACRKTLAELGLKQLKKCTRCMNAFYCSAECQRAQWKAGHKKACRKPGQIEPGDLMKLIKLQRRSDLNGIIVKTVMALNDREDDRWRVDIGKQKMIDVAVSNLEHIRPEK